MVLGEAKDDQTGRLRRVTDREVAGITRGLNIMRVFACTPAFATHVGHRQGLSWVWDKLGTVQ